MATPRSSTSRFACAFPRAAIVAAIVLIVSTAPALSQTISWVYLSDEVGSGLQTTLARALLSTATHGGVTVHIESSDTLLALITADELTPGHEFVDIFVPNGTNYANFYVQALEDTTGKVYLTATASGFTAGLDSIDVVTPSLNIVGLQSTLDPYAADDAFYVSVGVPNLANTAISGYATVEWSGRGDGGQPVASGVYFYRLVAGGRVETRKMVLLK